MLSNETKIPLMILFLALFFLGVAPQKIMAQPPAEVEIQADLLEYDTETGLVKASGNVRLFRGELEIKAGELVYDEKNQLVEACGGVKFNSPSLHLTGEKIRYSLLKKEGEITEVKGYQDDVFFSGSAGKVSGEEIVMEKAKLSRCELTTPCISIAANKLVISEKTATINGGWLAVKDLSFLPLPPSKFSTEEKDYENWPEIETGLDQDRGLYLAGKINRRLRDDLSLQFGAGLGTNSWAMLETGLRWRAFNVGGLFFDAGYSRNLLKDNEVFRSTLGLSRNWGTVFAEYEREWNGTLSETTLVKTILPLSAGLTGEAFYQIDAESSLYREDRKGVTYGIRLRKKIIPGIFAGIGLIHGAGVLSGFRGWSPETTFSGRFPLFPTWDISVNGSYQWGDGNGRWLTQKLEVSKDLHCFEAKLGYDWLANQISFKVGIKR